MLTISFSVSGSLAVIPPSVFQQSSLKQACTQPERGGYRQSSGSACRVCAACWEPRAWLTSNSQVVSVPCETQSEEETLCICCCLDLDLRGAWRLQLFVYLQLMESSSWTVSTCKTHLFTYINQPTCRLVEYVRHITP